MSTDETQSFFDDPDAALREIAQNPAAYAHYLADFHRVVLDMQAKLEILQRETRVHCRGTHVEGDMRGQAFLRSFPVEKSLNNVIKNLKNVTSGLEKSAHKRHAHDEKVKDVVKQRKEKAQLKEQKNNPPAIQPGTENGQQVHGNQNPGYANPASIYDLGDRRSA
ncbi:hypothetical protein [Streptomyces longisporus]|uniref:Uncharacterized protein n=1 Tax=Streptomyces longisporus TaxID=1948 RepID=A0ABP6AVF8_STRLO